jgi:hypothetical protein
MIVLRFAFCVLCFVFCVLRFAFRICVLRLQGSITHWPPHDCTTGLTTFLDVDVPPSVAIGPAQLTKSLNDIADVIGLSSVLKLTASAADELLQLAGVTSKREDDVVALGRQLARAFQAPLTVLTSGTMPFVCVSLLFRPRRALSPIRCSSCCCCRYRHVSSCQLLTHRTPDSAALLADPTCRV